MGIFVDHKICSHIIIIIIKFDFLIFFIIIFSFFLFLFFLYSSLFPYTLYLLSPPIFYQNLTHTLSLLSLEDPTRSSSSSSPPPPSFCSSLLSTPSLLLCLLFFFLLLSIPFFFQFSSKLKANLRKTSTIKKSYFPFLFISFFLSYFFLFPPFLTTTTTSLALGSRRTVIAGVPLPVVTPPFPSSSLIHFIFLFYFFHYLLFSVATPKPGPTQLAGPNRYPGDARPKPLTKSVY